MKPSKKKLVKILKERAPGHDLDEVSKQAGWENFFDYTEDEALQEFGPDEVKNTNPNWGGYREGSGRPAGTTKKNRKKAWATKLRPDQIEWLKSQPTSAAKVIELLIDDAMK